MWCPEDIIIEPILSEKSNELKEKNKYVFKVAVVANKIQIKQAMKKLYNVKIVSCKTINVLGKKKRQGKFIGTTSAYKKAIIKLNEGDKISVFEGI